MADEYGFHSEAIITGCVDSFCLVCEEYLKCERDVITTHVTKPVHRKNLLAVHYVDKYRDDHIRKVKFGYFCELCNLLLPTVAKVGFHVAETFHVDNKATKLLRRIGNTVIAFGNVSISERAWHGLMEDTCAICNVEYDNEDIHKNQPSHIIRLIQCKVQYGANKTIYRLIDNDSFQCLTCNMVISLKTITEHFNNSEHQKLYSEFLVSVHTEKLNDTAINDLERKQKDRSDKEIIKLNDDQDLQEKRNDRKNLDNFQLIPDPEIIKHKYDSQHIEITNDENRKKILDSVNKIQRSNINIDFEFQSAFCKKCLTALDFDCGLIEQHIEEHLHKPKEMADSASSYPPVNQNHNKTRLTLSDVPTSQHKTSKDEESNTYKHNIRALTGPNEAKSDNCKEIDGDKYEDRDSSVSSSSECYKGNATKSSSSKVTEDPPVSEDANHFAKRNQLTYSESCRTAYCRVCDARLPATLAAMKEHVAGSAHTIRTKKTSKPSPTSRKSNHFSKQTTDKYNHFSSQSMEKFIYSFILVKNGIDVERVIINRKYSVHIMSFMLVTRQDSRFRCQVCEVNFIEDCNDHVNGVNHRNKLKKIPVITSLDTEFVREVRPGLFHCGYCHLLVSDWDTLRTHLKCSEHKTRKTLLMMLLNKDLRELDEEREIFFHFMFLRMMLRNPFF